MKTILAIIVLSTYLNSALGADIPCEVASAVFKSLLARAEKDPTNMMWDRSRMDDMAKDCGVTLKEFGKPSTYLDELMKRGYQEQFKTFRSEILTMDPLERFDYKIRRMEEVAKKLGMSDADKKEIYRLKQIATQRQLNKLNENESNFQKSCTNEPKNLSNLLPPQRDQDTIGWCYAFAAADLISVKMGKNISEFDVALGYESKMFKEDVTLRPESIGNGGHISSAIRSSWNIGYCEEKNMAPAQTGVFHHIGPVMKTLESMYRKTPGMMEVRTCDLNDSLTPFTKNLKLKDVEDVLYAGSYGEALGTLRERACPERTKIEAEFAVSDILFPNPNFNSKQYIQKNLLQDRPVGISVNLKDVLASTEEEKVYAHAMVVMGQERDESGECVFIVRNSWGRSCAAFDKTKVACKKDGTVRMNPKTLDSILTMTTVIE